MLSPAVMVQRLWSRQSAFSLSHAMSISQPISQSGFILFWWGWPGKAGKGYYVNSLLGSLKQTNSVRTTWRVFKKAGWGSGKPHFVGWQWWRVRSGCWWTLTHPIRFHLLAGFTRKQDTHSLDKALISPPNPPSYCSCFVFFFLKYIITF